MHEIQTRQTDRQTEQCSDRGKDITVVETKQPSKHACNDINPKLCRQ